MEVNHRKRKCRETNGGQLTPRKRGRPPNVILPRSFEWNFSQKRKFGDFDEFESVEIEAKYRGKRSKPKEAASGLGKARRSDGGVSTQKSRGHIGTMSVKIAQTNVFPAPTSDQISSNSAPEPPDTIRSSCVNADS
eukprot:TRINITY_DN3581_c0_g1_i1.p1 TRINITY_DN3581_c0_g1~~TRINITY_DN3581_c0_g1_i1.p1  ORF type:complete len:136 (-),score=30.01 TRINITY_DN3581_c0_g1_i1:160-567(-)